MHASTTSASSTTPRAPSTARHRKALLLLAIAALFTVVPLASVVFGAASVSPAEALQVVCHHLLGTNTGEGIDPIVDAIIWQNRMPRVLTGIGVGAILGLSGVAFQAVVRNPLAEPYVLGVSSGASLGAAGAIVLIGSSSSLTVAGLAFLGAATATMVVLQLGGGRGGSAMHLILAGLGVGFICQALTNLIMFSARTAETAQSVVFWTLGSLTRADWPQVWLILVTAMLVTGALWIASPVLDALASGDDTCLSVGLNPGVARVLLLIPVSAAVAVAVSLAGGIGFIGLVVPHLMRPLIGHGHRWLVISSALAGAVFLTLADTLSRTAFSPVELPIGIITALVGAPFLLFLIRRTRQGW